MTSETPQGFLDAVLAWVQQRNPDAVKVISVEGHGSDWAGSTESGFYSVFDCDVSYRTSDGRLGLICAEGDVMESLWTHVVSAWPTSPVDLGGGQ